MPCNKRGGFDLFTSVQNLGTSISQQATNLWNKTKRATSDAYDTSYYPSSSTSYDSYVGGKRRRKSLKKHRRPKTKRGGYTSLTNIASTAAPFMGTTAKPHNWVGGRRSRKRRRSRR